MAHATFTRPTLTTRQYALLVEMQLAVYDYAKEIVAHERAQADLHTICQGSDEPCRCEDCTGKGSPYPAEHVAEAWRLVRAVEAEPQSIVSTCPAPTVAEREREWQQDPLQAVVAA